MKKFRSYFILILAAAVMTSCSGLNKMKKNSNLVKYEVTPKVLETHAGIVTVTIKGTFPEKYFDKKTTVTATPVLTYTGGETAFEKVQVLQGESVQANNKVITYKRWRFYLYQYYSLQGCYENVRTGIKSKSCKRQKKS